jgi:hypothetical protein
MLKSKRIATAAAGTAALFIALLAALAIARAWPFESASGDADSGGHHVIWQGEVALLGGSLYALDLLPVVAQSNCARCLTISSSHGQRSLSAGNGILGWPRHGAPSYAGCVAQRNNLTLDSVLLGAAHTSRGAVALHGWACATGGANDGLMRLRYDGARGGRYRFDVTSWGRPVEG